MEPPDSHAARPGTTITLALSMLLASLGTSVANIALPTLAVGFAAPFAEVQAVVIAYLAALTLSVVVAGRLGDRHGLKPMLVAGLAVFALASGLCGAAPSLGLLIAARALQGVGAAFLMTLALALMRATASEARMGQAMGLLGTVSAVGTALGPSLGGLLLSATGWRGLFWAQTPLAVVALILAFATLPERPGKGQAKPVPFMAVLNRRVALPLGINLVVGAVMMTTLVVGPFYLGRGLGLAPSEVGFVLALGPTISIVSGVPSGRLVDSWGSGRVLALGLALMSAGALLLAILPNRMGVAGYGLSILVLTPGYQLFQAANTTAVLANVPGDRRGVVSGLLGLSRNLGLIAGASVMGALFAFGVGTEDLVHASPAAIAAGMRLTFLTASGIMAAALGVAFGLRSLPQRPSPFFRPPR
jgi:MFS family permease